jgi:protein tyrosine phosphatase (PTP) superfamily phosphohydrolase (DUF442 family)
VVKGGFILAGRSGDAAAWAARAVGAGLLAAALAGCGAWPISTVGPATGPAGQAAAGIPGVPAFAKVSAALYRGGQPTAEGFANLRQAGVRTVVSLRTLGSDRSDLRGTGMRYLPLSFKHIHPEDEDVLAMLKTVEDPANQPVFLHCRDGRDRTGMMVAAYRVIEEGWSKADAIAEMKKMGFDVFWGVLESYVEHLDVAGLKASLHAMPPPALEVVE